MKKTLIIALSTLFIVSNCAEKKEEQKMQTYVNEPHSYAKPNEAVITHLNLDIDVDFDKK